jgi:hypothetical protein
VARQATFLEHRLNVIAKEFFGWIGGRLGEYSELKQGGKRDPFYQCIRILDEHRRELPQVIDNTILYLRLDPVNALSRMLEPY